MVKWRRMHKLRGLFHSVFRAAKIVAARRIAYFRCSSIGSSSGIAESRITQAPIHSGHAGTSDSASPVGDSRICLNLALCGAAKSRHGTNRTIVRSATEGCGSRRPPRGQDCGLKICSLRVLGPSVTGPGPASPYHERSPGRSLFPVRWGRRTDGKRSAIA